MKSRRQPEVDVKEGAPLGVSGVGRFRARKSGADIHSSYKLVGSRALHAQAIEIYYIPTSNFRKEAGCLKMR
jgi:hypothetical protein